ncbi:MAG: metal-dependent transcriptional regulator [Bacteroidia bacterium]
MGFSFTEENYLKAIYKLSQDGAEVTTNAISAHLKNKAATVTDMLKRLAEKKLIAYKPYQGVKLTEKGRRAAVKVIRKHRLWEVFLVDKLKFKWDEVHEIAEQLEHIHSDELIEKLDAFLGRPKSDPHGDPIPDENGRFSGRRSIPFSTGDRKKIYIATGVSDHSAEYLRYLTQLGVGLGDQLKIEDVNDYDQSFKIRINKKEQVFISHKAAMHLLVEQKS